jgi:hypothetical protein
VSLALERLVRANAGADLRALRVGLLKERKHHLSEESAPRAVHGICEGRDTHSTSARRVEARKARGYSRCEEHAFDIHEREDSRGLLPLHELLRRSRRESEGDAAAGAESGIRGRP